MEIVRLRGVYQNLEKKNKELESKIDDLTLKNNHLSKENISLKYSRKELPKQNNNANDKNKLDNIKSFNILKSIFYCLSRSALLDFICYNKTIQGKLCINIEDYKKFGNRIKIGEITGLGKEYKLNTDILIFEGW